MAEQRRWWEDVTLSEDRHWGGAEAALWADPKPGCLAGGL